MTKKHFITIANTIKLSGDLARGSDQAEAVLATLANSLAYEFGRENPQFNAARFLNACSVPGYVVNRDGRLERVVA